ncbi:hypothetical protein MRX96_020501 [Rhipicephalus microplus]
MECTKSVPRKLFQSSSRVVFIRASLAYFFGFIQMGAPGNRKPADLGDVHSFTGCLERKRGGQTEVTKTRDTLQ